MIKFLRAKKTANKDGLPLEWPVKAELCAKDYEPTDGWEKGTRAELQAIKEGLKAEYDSWKAKLQAEQRKREEDKKLAQESSCKSAQEKLAKLGFTDEEIKKVMGDRYCE
jgi:hypothetical protein